MNDADAWQPGASMAVLRQRAALFASIRQFFASRKVLEVDTPLLSGCFGSDPCIEPIVASINGGVGYLQSSPEFFLKRLLAAGSGDIYSLGRAFRNEESGRRHNPEFTLLEWYRCGWDEYQLMDEVEELVTVLLDAAPAKRVTYAELFENAIGLNPHTATLEQLYHCARQCGEWVACARAATLDLLFAERVEPTLPAGLVFICDFPSSHSALAQIQRRPDGETVARRFELYCDGIELANGYLELADANEQQYRFNQELEQRRSSQLPIAPLDHALLAALDHGMPDCAGVALGVDRLLMAQLGVGDIDSVQPFSWPRCH
ncbi:MAG: EF-P lysine aminoacylase EpmA [Porticoccaceae bacterium]